MSVRTTIRLLLLALLPVAGFGGTNVFETDLRPAVTCKIDAAVFERLAKLGIEPANICSDAVFVRRVYLDAIGTLPTVEEARDFLADNDPEKRAALIDKLLERDEFADYWSMKWADLLRVKAEFPINLWPNAVQAYHRWIRASIKQNKSYDRFARELITSSGSNFREPPANFYRAMQGRSAEGIAKTVALTFMGLRAEKWPTNALAEMAVFFSCVSYKSTAEWKEEIVFFDAAKARNLPRRAVLPDGENVDVPAGADPRVVFADWLTKPENPYFTRNIANRVWSWLLGRGVIHEPDDIRADNPPVNPELLAALAQELAASKFDLKALFRSILNSSVYQLSCVPQERSEEAEENFAFYPLRRLEAETLIDALNQATWTVESYSSAIPEPFTFIPEEQRAIALADASISSPFLEMFGRSARDTGLESERNNHPTAAQRLHLLNSTHIQRKIQNSPTLMEMALSQQAPRRIVTHFYLTFLSRYPTDEELKAVAKHAEFEEIGRREIAWDVAWALINSMEFLYRH